MQQSGIKMVKLLTKWSWLSALNMTQCNGKWVPHNHITCFSCESKWFKWTITVLSRYSLVDHTLKVASQIILISSTCKRRDSPESQRLRVWFHNHFSSVMISHLFKTTRITYKTTMLTVHDSAKSHIYFGLVPRFLIFLHSNMSLHGTAVWLKLG